MALHMKSETAREAELPGLGGRGAESHLVSEPALGNHCLYDKSYRINNTKATPSVSIKIKIGF